MIEKVLAEDDRNYHCWGLIIFLYKRNQFVENHLQWVKNKIDSNVLNNSAWSFYELITSKENIKEADIHFVEDKIC